MTDVPEYHEAAATRIMRDLPRFGHSKTFSYITGNKEQQQDYIFGLLFAGAFIIAFFLAWTVLLAIFKCLGQAKIGFVSGKPFEVPAESKRPRRVRASFILSAVILIIFTVLLVTEGLTQIQTGVGSVYDSSVEWNVLTTEAKFLVSRLIEIVEIDAEAVREDLLKTTIESICEGVDLETETGYDFEGLSQNMTTALEQLGDFYQEELTDVNEALTELEEMSLSAVDTSEAITLGSWQSLIFLIPFPIFCTLLVGGVLLICFGRYYQWYARFLTWGVLPLFFILIVICYLLSGATAIAASANADFCSGGTENTPQQTILEIMLLNGHSTEDITFRIIEFYVTTCTESGGDPLAFFGEYKNDLMAATNALSRFERGVTASEEEFTELCGEESFVAIQLAMSSMERAVSDLTNITTRAVDLVACERVLPIFTSAMWGGACEYSVQGVTWTFSAFLVIAMMGMLMITFRSSWLPTEELYDGKVSILPLDYEEGQHVQYQSPQPEKFQEHDGDAEAPSEDVGGVDAAVATGVAVGAVAGAAVVGQSQSNDETDTTEEIAKQESGEDDVAGVVPGAAANNEAASESAMSTNEVEVQLENLMQSQSGDAANDVAAEFIDEKGA